MTTDNVPMGAATEYTGTPIHLSILGNASAYTIGYDLTAYTQRLLTTDFPRHRRVLITDGHLRERALELIGAGDCAMHVVEYPGTSAVDSCIAGDIPVVLVLPPGEESKSRAMKAWIEDCMLEAACTRSTVVIALGGGVVGDLAGYVAATFMRGVPVVQVPTTLLAMVDSSIGGKTAIDTPRGKNLVGAFWQPHAIVADLRYLETLPARQFFNGMAEIIKTGAFWDAALFEFLEKHAELMVSMAALGGKRKCAMSQNEISTLFHMVHVAAQVKAYVVTNDERESGLRGLLNFGHTVGHAIEAVLSPELLHGEAVAVGMVKEAECARFLGHLKQENLGRLVRCIKAYNLPAAMDDPLLETIMKRTGKRLRLDRLMDIMKVDKKNVGTQKRIVLLSDIGDTVEKKPSNVDDAVIRRAIAPAIRVYPAPADISSRHITITVPGSKSVSNRVLVLAALSHGTCRIRGLLHSDDTQVMLAALQKMRACTFEYEEGGDVVVIHGSGGALTVPSEPLYLGNAGTAVRFLTSVCTLISATGSDAAAMTSGNVSSMATPAETIVTGNKRMQQRPIGDLVDALNASGCSLRYLRATGCPPLAIAPTGLPGGIIHLAANVSSQYVSSILLAAPLAQSPITLDLGSATAHVVSQPYIDMTIAMIRAFGVEIIRDASNPNQYHIPLAPVDTVSGRRCYVVPSTGWYNVEPDASSATYPLAFAALTGATVTVPHLGPASVQGDAQFGKAFLEKMGATVTVDESGVTVRGPQGGALRSGALQSIGRIDFEPMTDAFLTAAVVAACSNAGNGVEMKSTTLYGIANQRVKECNRIEAMVTELGKFGVKAWEVEDGIGVEGLPLGQWMNPSMGIHCYDDHRVAMSFSVLAAALAQNDDNSVLLQEKKCVEKTWPTWWDDLEKVLGVRCEGADFDAETETHGKPAAAAPQPSLVLIGMRGVGKTTLGCSLAAQLGYRFIDIDQELESTSGRSIALIIKESGWTEFRRLESETLIAVLSTCTLATVVSCGGGIIEGGPNIDALEQWTNEGRAVVHLRRPIDDIISFLDQDTSRPSFGQDIRSVWEKRRPLYERCSNYEFWAVPVNGRYNWPAIEQSFGRFTRSILGEYKRELATTMGDPKRRQISSDNDNKKASFFVSLTFPDMEPYVASLAMLCEGADAVEFRADLLADNADREYVARQLALVRQHISLPIIFTVRSRDQGGAFADNDEQSMFALLQLAVRWGCEIVDMEVSSSDGALDTLSATKRHAVIIASYHDTHSARPWTMPSMIEMCRRANAYGDIVKVIGKAADVECNFELSRLLTDKHSPIASVRKPVIAMNMGAVGQMSRLLNRFMTPVTHPLMPTKAAPGQLSIVEIHQGRHLLGLLPARSFHLLGSPIAQSMSPALHNAGYKSLGLPHSYDLFEASTVTPELRALIRSPTFGGASVTIPLKQEVLTLMDELTPAAMAIGAVNTIIPMRADTDDSIIKLIGDNTDYIGIKRCLEKAVAGATPKAVLVIGAGGTARAACYAAKELGATLAVWNRTTAKAQELATQFGGTAISAEALDPAAFDAIIGTVPGTTQTDLPFFANSQHTLFGIPSVRPRVYVELAYTPRLTPMMQKAGSCGWKTVVGVDVLVEQGLEQFERWTGRHPPLPAAL